MSWPVLIGGVLVFFGYLLFIVGDLSFLRLPDRPTYEQVLIVSIVYIAGELVLAVGFLLAFVGIAVGLRR